MSQFEDGMKAFRSLLQVGLKIENLQNGFALDPFYLLSFIFELRNKY